MLLRKFLWILLTVFESTSDHCRSLYTPKYDKNREVPRTRSALGYGSHVSQKVVKLETFAIIPSTC